MLITRQIDRDIGVDADGDQRFDDRPIYRWRYRLMAFQQVVTGNRGIDLILDNTLAYGLVAGTTEPTRSDLEVARSVLPRLIKQTATNEEDHALHDTVGCVHFALGDYAKAVTVFEAALKHFESATAKESASWLSSDADRRRVGKMRTHLQALYSRRLDAARSNAQKVANGTAPDDPGLLSLPRDLGQPLPVPSTPGAAAVEATGSRP
ncbi:MAG TPA: tetratricopeptide repeat protein [Planctomycetota bacterium]|nr:tetratricopeptide repeat protein [Planctomycetota bacterium]